jgi:hypothetical protein
VQDIVADSLKAPPDIVKRAQQAIMGAPAS